MACRFSENTPRDYDVTMLCFFRIYVDASHIFGELYGARTVEENNNGGAK